MCVPIVTQLRGQPHYDSPRFSSRQRQPPAHLYLRYIVYTAFCRQRTTRRTSFTVFDTPALLLPLAGTLLPLSLPMLLAVLLGYLSVDLAGKRELRNYSSA